MNWQHLQTFLWLRYRLMLNQLRRGGAVNAVIQTAFAVGVAVLAVLLFVAFFVVGLLLLGNVSPMVLLYVWDGLVVAFLFAWLLGLLLELQRSEVLSLDKFLHLPVSLTSAFLINYASSFFSPTLLLFLPSMAALALALVFSRGPTQLVVLPLLAAFIVMVTALTYQFQGWLAALMVNPRRRRLVIVFLTGGFILLCQLPNIINLGFQPWNRLDDNSAAQRLVLEQSELTQQYADQKLDAVEFQQRSAALQKAYEDGTRERDRGSLEHIERDVRLVNLCLPFCWLPYGATTAAEGNVVPALLGTFAFGAAGALSLWRSYRTTLRLYTGQFTANARAAPATLTIAKPLRDILLERRLPWLSEPVSAVALGGFQALLRAPEVKMILLTPVILVVVFGGLAVANSIQLSEAYRPLAAYGALSTILFSLTQLLGNQFGFDRGGFRLFVLSAVSRRDILVGKNLAVAPLAFGLSIVLILALEVLAPLRIEHLVALPFQLLSMYLLFCLLANCMSILTPMAVRSGTLKAVNPRGLTILLQLVFLLLFPVILSPTLLPLGIEMLVEAGVGEHGIPLCLLLTLLEAVIVALLYRLIVSRQGDWLQAREQRILETITTKTE